MGINDAGEMLEVAKEECGRLERAVAALKLTAAEDLRYVRRIEGENVDLLLTMTELKPAEVLVEGNYFAMNDLPAILGNFIRLNDENAASMKRGWLHTEQIKAERDAANAAIDQVLNLIGDIGPRARRILMTHLLESRATAHTAALQAQNAVYRATPMNEGVGE